MEKNINRPLLVVLNIIGLFATIVVNALANALPLNGRNTGVISDSIPNLFVPAGLTFAIWGLIYGLLILLVVYQAVTLRKASAPSDPIGSLGIWFFISCVANSLWIIAWHWGVMVLSLVLMLVLLLCLIIMHTRIRSHVGSPSTPFKVAVSLPISIYLGWITVATVANATALLVVTGWDRLGMSETFWTVVVMLVAILINMLAVVLKGDIGFALVGLWAMFGIFYKRALSGLEPVEAVTTTAIAGMIVLGVVIIARLVTVARKRAKPA
jgi:hypothetical protein